MNTKMNNWNSYAELFVPMDGSWPSPSKDMGLHTRTVTVEPIGLFEDTIWVFVTNFKP